MTIEPKCLAMDRTKQIQFTSYGYFLPCCECDTQASYREFKNLGFFNEKFHISNINDADDVKTILSSDEWQNFYKGLFEIPSEMPKVCQRFCKEGWDNET